MAQAIQHLPAVQRAARTESLGFFPWSARFEDVRNDASRLSTAHLRLTSCAMNQHHLNSHPMIESLDARRLLSAAVNDGILTITGTEGDDTINFWFPALNPDRIVVQVNTSEDSFERAGISLIRVLSLDGDDRVSPLNRGGQIDIRLSMDGGAGDDLLVGGLNNDTVIGNLGNDDLRGDEGVDFADYRYVETTVSALASGLTYGLIANVDGDTNDITSDGVDNIQLDIEGILATRFRDSISQSGLDSFVFGLDGNDQIYGSSGNDFLDGGEGFNNIIGGSGADTLVGGSGNSTLEGDSGNDLLRGGSGDEMLAGGLGRDRYNGGPGFDTADFTGIDGAMALSFDGEFNDGPNRQGDNFIEIDEVITTSDGDGIDASGLGHGIVYRSTGIRAIVTGSEFDDELSAGDGEFFGIGGSDLIQAGLGGSLLKNVIEGGKGNDSIFTADGDDVIAGNDGNDSITSGDGNDSINAGAGRDTVLAGVGDDSIRGAKDTDRLFGEEGNDTIYGDGRTNDFIFTGPGEDQVLRSENEDGYVRDFDSEFDVNVLTERFVT
jgi:Ca2+-binding RTX toxin-like protein